MSKEIQEQLDRIEFALVGDEKLGTKGVIPRLRSVEASQEAMGRKFIYFSGFMTALVVVWEAFKHKLVG